MAFERSGPPCASDPTPLAALGGAMARCRICRDAPRGEALPHEPRPIFQMPAGARVIIASQAPGMRAHVSGVPFDDASGRRLREWLGLGVPEFYDVAKVGIIPMGFCFPGYDANGGDRPPRPECRARWHDEVFAALPRADLILAIGTHAMRYHIRRLGLGVPAATGMTDLVLGWRGAVTPEGVHLVPLPHPSWRNTAWIKRNPAFESEILPKVRDAVRARVG